MSIGFEYWVIIDYWVIIGTELLSTGFESSCSHLNFRFRACFEKQFLEIQATIKCGSSLKRAGDMITTYSQMHRTDKYSLHSLIIWPVWLNGLSVRWRTKWLWVRVQLQSLIIYCLWKWLIDIDIDVFCHSFRKLLVSINQSSYLICFCYNFFDKAKWNKYVFFTSNSIFGVNFRVA